MDKAGKHFLMLLGILCIFGCQDPPKEERVEAPVEHTPPVIDLPTIKERGKLVLLTENSSVSYFLYRGQAMGFDYELVRDFARSQGLELEVRILEDMNDMFELLNEGKGDLIACNLTLTEPRKEWVAFSEPMMETTQVLVQHKPENWKQLSPAAVEDSLIRSLEELNGREIYVHQYSSFFENLNTIKATEYGVEVIEASGNLDSEQLIRLVAEEQIDLTVADENMALLNATYYPEIDVAMELSEAQPISWAVRKDADSLLMAINDWMAQRSTKRRIAYTRKKYFSAKKDQYARVNSPFSSLSGKQISEYDPAIKRFSEDLRWDWKLLAAMIYQESRFNPEAKSWAGAFGLMQLMPQTAKRFGIDTTQTQTENIRAGVAYLKYLDNFWRNRIHDPQERLKFILASYNVGPGHVQDAQRIAQHVGKNPYEWDNNVEDCLLLKSEQKYLALEGVRHGYCRGKEPYHYVRSVMNLYAMYQTIEL